MRLRAIGQVGVAPLAVLGLVALAGGQTLRALAYDAGDEVGAVDVVDAGGIFSVPHADATTLPVGCGVIDSPARMLTASAQSVSSLSAATPRVCEIAIDADYEYFVRVGSSLSLLQRDAEALVFGVSSRLRAEGINLRLELTRVIARTNPATQPYTQDNLSTLLSTAQGEWDGPLVGVRRDIVHLLSGKGPAVFTGGSIGLAYTAAACMRPYAVGVSKARYSETASFDDRTALLAHEIGHTLGANHCDAPATPCYGQTCGVMCSTLGQCNGPVRYETCSANQIISYLQSGGCLRAASASITPPLSDAFAGAALDSVKWTYIDGPVAAGAIPADLPVIPAPNRPVNPARGMVLSVTSPVDVRSGEVLLAGIPSASVSFLFAQRGVPAGGGVAVQYLDTQGVWRTLGRLVSGGVPDSPLLGYNALLPADARHDLFRLRLLSEGPPGGTWYVTSVRAGARSGCRSDINGDGTISSDDLVTFFGAFFASNLTIADVDRSGTLSADDVVSFFSGFFEGCF